MNIIVCTNDNLSNMQFRKDYPKKFEGFVEKSRHIQSEKESPSPLLVMEVLADTKIIKKFSTEDGPDKILRTSYIEFKCMMMFPNSKVPRLVLIQMAKRGEQGFPFLDNCHHFIVVKGFHISHCLVENEMRTNLVFSDSNVIDIYKKGAGASKQANTLNEFAYDLFVKQNLPFPASSQRINYMKIGMTLENVSLGSYNEATMFHVSDLYFRTEGGIFAKYRNYIADNGPIIPTQKQAKHEAVSENMGRNNNVLDISMYGNFFVMRASRPSSFF